VADRVVSVRLQAEIGQYVAGMGKAAASTKAVGSSAEQSGKRSKSAFDLAGKGATLFGLGAAGALAGVVNKAMDFDKSMSAVQAATRASGAELAALRETAMKAGADTQYSATEAADAITEMAKAGVSAKDIMGGGLSGALALAAAGQMDVADAAGIASVAMTQFNLTGAQLPHVADLLAAGAGKAMGEVSDLGQALNQAGLIASGAGLSIEETTGTLSAFASAGLIGSDAGTSFKTMLQRLQAPVGDAADMMKQLGISLYDANGQTLGMSEVAGQLQGALSDMTPAARDNALAVMFGSDAVRAANVLYREGQKGIAEWTDKVNDQGFAARQAAALTDNLAGDLERLGGSFDTLLITLGEGAQGPLREVVQMLGSIVDGITWTADAFGDLPGPIQLAIGAAGLWAVAGGRITGAFDGARNKVRAFREEVALQQALFAAQNSGLSDAERALGGLGASAERGGQKFALARSAVAGFARAIGPELGVGLAVAGIGYLVSTFQELTQASDSAQVAAEGLSSALTLTNRAADERAIRQAIEDTEGLVDVLGKAGVASDVAIAGLLGNAGAQRQVNTAIQDYITYANTQLGYRGEEANAAVEGRQAYEELATGYGGAAGAARYFGASAEEGAEKVAGATPIIGSALQATVQQTEEATKAIEDWRAELQTIGASFVEPLDTYKGLLDEKNQAEREAAEKTAASTKSSKDSWEDYVEDVDVSLDELAARLEEENKAHDQWRSNLVRISSRGGKQVASILATMGEEGADLTAKMAKATDEDFNRMAKALVADAKRGGAGAAAALDTELNVMERVGKRGAKDTADVIAKQLGIGVEDVARIAKKYGVELAVGINPVLGALGRSKVDIERYRRKGGFAAGGYTGAGGKYEYAGPAHKGEVVWSQEDVAAHGGPRRVDALRRARGYADGGFVTAADVPKPPSTRPYRHPISTAGDATMRKGYDEAREFVEKNAASSSLSGGAFGNAGGRSPVGIGGLGPVAAAARQFVMETWGLRNIGGYSFRNIAGTNTLSDHALGKAIDVMIPDYRSPASIAKGNAVASWFVGHPGNFGTKYVIWRDQINSGGGWGSYGHPGGFGDDTSQHRDHVHVSFYKDGTPYVGSDRLAYLHQGEAVVPAAVNARSREMAGRVGGGHLAGTAGGLEGLRLVGTLDLGDGITGRINATIAQVLTSANRSLSAAGVR
jgi:TP901 family phage tail tape measure protein